MKLSTDSDFYDFLENKVQKDKNKTELINVIKDLSEISFEGSDLQSHYSSVFGHAYFRPDGFVQFIYDSVRLIEKYYRLYQFDFSLTNCVRVLVFESLRPFMREKLKKKYSVQGFGPEERDTVYFYLQEFGVSLEHQEHLYFVDEKSDIRQFLNGIKSSIKVPEEKLENSEFDGTDESRNGVSDVEDREEDSEVIFDDNEEIEEDEGGEDSEDSGEDEAAAAFEELF